MSNKRNFASRGLGERFYICGYRTAGNYRIVRDVRAEFVSCNRISSQQAILRTTEAIHQFLAITHTVEQFSSVDLDLLILGTFASLF